MAEHVVEVDVVEERVGVRDKQRMAYSTMLSRVASRRHGSGHRRTSMPAIVCSIIGISLRSRKGVFFA